MKKEYIHLGELINYPNGDYYGGLDVGFNFDMLQQLRRYTDFTTTYSSWYWKSYSIGVYNNEAGVKYKLDKDPIRWT